MEWIAAKILPTITALVPFIRLALQRWVDRNNKWKIELEKMEALHQSADPFFSEKTVSKKERIHLEATTAAICGPNVGYQKVLTVLANDNWPFNLNKIKKIQGKPYHKPRYWTPSIQRINPI